jgi:HEAT repeat protein
VLTASLQDADSFVAQTAAETLGNMGPAAASAVPQLVKLLTPGDDVETLYAQEGAIRALGKIGASAREALPELQKLREAEDGEGRRDLITEAINRIEQDSKK